MKLQSILLAAACSLALGTALGGCSYFQNSAPQDQLDAASNIVTIAENGYDAMCASTVAPKFCTDARAITVYGHAKTVVADAIKATQDYINADGNDSAKLSGLLLNAFAAASDVAKIVQDFKDHPSG